MTQLCWTPCLSRAMSNGILLSSSLRLKSAIQKSRATCCPAPSSQSPELKHLTVLQPRLTLTYVPVQFFLVCRRSRKLSFPVGSLTACARKVGIRALQVLSALLVSPAVLFHQLPCGSPMRIRACEQEASFICLKASSITSF